MVEDGGILSQAPKVGGKSDLTSQSIAVRTDVGCKDEGFTSADSLFELFEFIPHVVSNSENKKGVIPLQRTTPSEMSSIA